jgi:hypothetical protein
LRDAIDDTPADTFDSSAKLTAAVRPHLFQFTSAVFHQANLMRKAGS